MNITDAEYSDLGRDKVRKKAEQILNDMAKSVESIPEPDPTVDVTRSLFQVSCSLIMWFSIIGTLTLMIGGVRYLMIPSPSGYVTTQDGKIEQITKLKQ